MSDPLWLIYAELVFYEELDLDKFLHNAVQEGWLVDARNLGHRADVRDPLQYSAAIVARGKTCEDLLLAVGHALNHYPEFDGWQDYHKPAATKLEPNITPSDALRAAELDETAVLDPYSNPLEFT